MGSEPLFIINYTNGIRGYRHPPGSSSSKCHVQVTLTGAATGKIALNTQQMPHRWDDAAQEKLHVVFTSTHMEIGARTYRKGPNMLAHTQEKAQLPAPFKAGGSSKDPSAFPWAHPSTEINQLILVWMTHVLN